MRIQTSSNPLILNFMTPTEPKVVPASEVEVFYDPVSEISYCMGGGGGSGQTRSDDKTRTDYTPPGKIPNDGYWRYDHERYTDD